MSSPLARAYVKKEGRARRKRSRQSGRRLRTEIFRLRPVAGLSSLSAETQRNQMSAETQNATEPLLATAFAPALKQALSKGLMPLIQYNYIATEICAKRPCSVLVFGSGYDGELWKCCAGQAVAWVEDDPKYASLSPRAPLIHKF